MAFADRRPPVHVLKDARGEDGVESGVGKREVLDVPRLKVDLRVPLRAARAPLHPDRFPSPPCRAGETRSAFRPLPQPTSSSLPPRGAMAPGADGQLQQRLGEIVEVGAGLHGTPLAPAGVARFRRRHGSQGPSSRNRRLGQRSSKLGSLPWRLSAALGAGRVCRT